MRLPWTPRHERRQWRSATTLPELGELMARWLEGDLCSRPGYQPRYSPDENCHEILPALTTACRAGFLTEGFEPGHSPRLDEDGTLWEQRAAVAGFINDPALLRRITRATEDAGVRSVVHERPDTTIQCTVPVTLRDAETITWYGGALDMPDLRFVWQECSEQALDTIGGARQVTLIDPDFTDNSRLWDLLTHVADGPSDKNTAA